MESLIYVNYKRSLLVSDVEKQLSDIIETRIKALPNYLEHKLNPELILLACNLVENGVKDKNVSKINKKSLVIKILQTVFTLNPAEIKQLDNVIEFLHSNKKIKLVGVVKKIRIVGKDWLKRKLL
jgi:hypothetical protein